MENRDMLVNFTDELKNLMAHYRDELTLSQFIFIFNSMISCFNLYKFETKDMFLDNAKQILEICAED